jgi:hypothetical protein
VQERARTKISCPKTLQVYAFWHEWVQADSFSISEQIDTLFISVGCEEGGPYWAGGPNFTRLSGVLFNSLLLLAPGRIFWKSTLWQGPPPAHMGTHLHKLSVQGCINDKGPVYFAYKVCRFVFITQEWWV